MEKTSTQGPLINQRAVDKMVLHLMDDTLNQGGANIVFGMKPLPESTFFEPTILTDVGADCQLAHTEIFGPVVAIQRFRDEEDVLTRANASKGDLAGYAFTKDIVQMHRVMSRLQVGMLSMNEGAISCAEAAFGGVKKFGFGREGASQGIDEKLNKVLLEEVIKQARLGKTFCPGKCRKDTNHKVTQKSSPRVVAFATASNWDSKGRRSRFNMNARMLMLKASKHGRSGWKVLKDNSQPIGIVLVLGGLAGDNYWRAKSDRDFMLDSNTKLRLMLESSMKSRSEMLAVLDYQYAAMNKARIILVPLYSINGITECFAFALMDNAREIFNHGAFLFAASAAHLILNALLCALLGAPGFILANCISTALRIAYNWRLVGGRIGNNARSLRLTSFLPTTTLCFLLLFALFATTLSLLLFGSVEGLIHSGAHVAIGGLMFFLVLGYLYQSGEFAISALAGPEKND